VTSIISEAPDCVCTHALAYDEVALKLSLSPPLQPNVTVSLTGVAVAWTTLVVGVEEPPVSPPPVAEPQAASRRAMQNPKRLEIRSLWLELFMNVLLIISSESIDS